jgi:hypothetical protein
MRTLEGHKVNPANDKLTITVLGEPGAGRAHHKYMIEGYKRQVGTGEGPVETGVVIAFQNGPIAEAGVNGITHEALLAILIDRLQAFQAGPFANPHNEAALKYLEGAQHELQARTKERMERGVEGTHNA